MKSSSFELLILSQIFPSLSIKSASTPNITLTLLWTFPQLFLIPLNVSLVIPQWSVSAFEWSVIASFVKPNSPAYFTNSSTVFQPSENVTECVCKSSCKPFNMSIKEQNVSLFKYLCKEKLY